MQAHRNGPTPPPLPRNPSRSLSTSTVSTVQTNYTKESGLMPPSPVGGAPLASPVSLNGRQPSYGFGTSGDELDKLGYMYSLRVAVLHHHLSHPPPPPMTHRASVASAFSLHHTPPPPVPPMPSPPLHGTSPNGSRLTFSTFSPPPGSAQAPVTPEMGSTPTLSGTTPSPGGRRKSSGFGLSLGRNKSDDGQSVKLPKEFLLEFWGILANEDGDAVWKSTTASFLGLIKKGTKTPSGLNLREVPTLLEAFTQSILPSGPGSTPAHIHQSHLLQLLYNSLPRSSFFSPLAKPQTEKDRDFLFRLRAEVQSYMLAPSPNPELDSSSSAMSMTPTTPTSPNAPPLNVRRKSSGIGLGRISTHSQDSIKRKPSPIWDGDVNEMVDTVGQVWGVRKDILDRDVVDIKRSGVLEQMYMSDLKRAMTAMSSQPPPLTPSQKSRQAQLSQSIANLLKDFPDLATPGSPNDFSSNPPFSPTSSRSFGGESSQPSFFVPPRSVEVFGRLATRSVEVVGHSTKSRDLLERCRDIWGIASRREKEKELEVTLKRWGDSIGTKDEVNYAKSIAESVKLMSYGIRPGDPLSPILSELLSTLLSLLTTSLPTIFPTTANPPPSPPPSLLIIFNAAPELFEAQPHCQRIIDNASDELKGAAIGEYVQAVEYLTGGVGQQDDGLRTVGSNGKDKLVEGFENVAKWILKEVGDVKRVWGKGVGRTLNPSAIIISRQLPLFLAELQVIDKPRGVASDIFSLYDTTGKLLDLWDDLCPKQEHGFELDAFFEPHVMAWLKDTETSQVHDWVSRAVGMDSWVPEGENKHSQSVIDLFEFIRSSAQVILHDLPLSEYKRAVFLIDYSKTVSLAVSTYATTVLALFQHDINPAKVSTPTSEIQNKLGSKAGSWLAKGQQAVKNLEKKKVDGFAVPPAACVKLTDMSAAKQSLEDLMYAMEAEDTARIVKSHKSTNAANDKTSRHVFTVTILRGENLLGRGGTKAADGFVVVSDRETGERLIKTRTVLGAEDPRWEQSFEISVASIKLLELTAFDRQLVGKHDLIGGASFKLDPRLFAEHPTRDIVLPLTTSNRGGIIHIRISMEGGEKNDVAYHLSIASRALDRSQKDMSRELIDRMSEYIRSQLSSNTLNNLTKPLKDKKKAKTVLSDGDIEGSLGGLFDYLNENFSVFSVTLNHSTRLTLMLSLWRRIIDILISLLVPPLSDKPYHGPTLGSSEIDVVFKWLGMLKSFFNASEGGVEHGVPIVKLQSGNYKDLIMLGQYLDLPTPTLKDRTSAAVKVASGFRSLRVDSAIEEDEGTGNEGERMAEILLRIARTRPDMGEFLSHEIGLLNRGRVEKQAGVM
uniref:Cytoplasmic protein n=1 Tax=Kwoniella bestiolae CBS 10118 TaxID=1296100 RepID=A0A1B9G700_9TREE|nr:cytoplasmic protein [Kwoniella bestiolae CBS 10118]OCF26814.1 cytoplasmic protein [Kwoniella bestiolae CBS 10118]